VGNSLFVSIRALGSSKFNFAGHVLYVVLMHETSAKNNFDSVAEDSAAQSSDKLCFTKCIYYIIII
jgi:hypothetical protein